MESIIKKAIEGGYDSPFVTKKQISSYRHKDVAVMALIDPLFWQSLGKACGWDKVSFRQSVPAQIRTRINKRAKSEATRIIKDTIPAHIRMMKRPNPNGWKKHALRFHEINLTEGWEKAVEYLLALTETKE